MPAQQADRRCEIIGDRDVDLVGLVSEEFGLFLSLRLPLGRIQAWFSSNDNDDWNNGSDG